ncbi:MAG: beta-ketoacyl-[acyl-carrier-protein] synthase family protein [Thermoanaerobaculia bacterium]
MRGVSVVVTGLGPVSAIGCGRNDYWEGLEAGRHGIGPITLCDTSGSPSKIGAEVKGFHLDSYIEKGNILARHTPRPVQLGLAASVLALHDAELDLDACDPDRLGIHVGTSVGNLGDMFRLRDLSEKSGRLSPHAAFHAFNHSAACVLSSFFNIRGPIHTTTSGCNSGIDALGQSTRMIQAGAADAMLVVGSDCELIPEVLLALNASGSLATRYNDRPGEASRPFDRGRDGNVIGEGAAALLLEAEPHAEARGARVYARVAGYQVCSAGRNRQYSHDDPELDIRPCVRAFRGAMEEAGWAPGDVDLMNANGSSSVIYDRLEGMALMETFGKSLPALRVHSIKSMLGQHGAGSSALQAVAACLSIRRSTAPPTINRDDPDPACGPLRTSPRAERVDVSRVLTHSIGLGGFYYSVAAFEKPGDEDRKTGFLKVAWSADGGESRFHPSGEFQKPLVPWKPRED